MNDPAAPVAASEPSVALSARVDLALGFDYGKRRVGLAIGNAVAATAEPLVTLAHIDGQPDWAALDRLVDEWRPDAFVVGRPLTEDGASQKMTRRATNFANELRGRYNKPVQLIDERYSTIEARERLARARASGSRGRRLAKGDSDAMAAQVILESWLQGTIDE